MNQNQADFLLPTFTRPSPIRTTEFDYDRIDPNILLINHQDPCHIIYPGYEQGGINTRDYVKRVYGTSLENTIRVPFCHTQKESQPIKPQHIKMLDKDCPLLTYLECQK